MMTDRATDDLPLVDFHNSRRAHGYLVGGPMTPDQVTAARDAGYQRIIDLREPGEPGVPEERARAEELGIDYVSLPVSGETGPNLQDAQTFHRLLTDESGPTIIHCRSSNRVGALFALRAYYIEKKPMDEALQKGRDAGLASLEPTVRRQLGD